MRYALDSCIALKWALQEPDSPAADALRRDYRNGVHDLIAPDVFPIEVAHALTRAERRGILVPGEAARLLADVLSTAPVFYSYLPLLQRATEISSQMRVGVYDCVYVALAEREQCALVTADDKLVKNLGAQFPFILSLASLP
jgi:predicted nucleic acid-binding protein